MSDLGNKEIMAQNIKYYMSLKQKDRNEVCKDLDLKYSTFSEWVNGNKYPRIDKIEIMANYFGVTKADLVEERTTQTHILPDLTSKDERQIAKDLEDMISSLGGAAAMGNPEDTEDMEMLKASLETAMRLSKRIAKKKYTPKKYRKE